MNYFQCNWYLLYTRPNHERKIAAYLQELGMEHYLPMVKTELKKLHQRKPGLTPLFPSYIFIYLDNVKDYYTASNAPGVINFVKLGGQLAKVDPQVIQSIKLLLDQDIKIDVVNEFIAGQEIVVKTGPFCGLSGEIIKYLGKKKVQIRIHAMQCSLLVSIALDHLAAN